MAVSEKPTNKGQSGAASAKGQQAIQIQPTLALGMSPAQSQQIDLKGIANETQKITHLD